MENWQIDLSLSPSQQIHWRYAFLELSGLGHTVDHQVLARQVYCIISQTRAHAVFLFLAVHGNRRQDMLQRSEERDIGRSTVTREISPARGVGNCDLL